MTSENSRAYDFGTDLRVNPKTHHKLVRTVLEQRIEFYGANETSQPIGMAVISQFAKADTTANRRHCVEMGQQHG